ncbi:hypothetical protein D3C81_1747200 [compost metagenome]
MLKLRPGNTQQLFADVADIADPLAKIVTGGKREFVADLLHIANDGIRQAQAFFDNQTKDIRTKLVILNK